jgi:hypothetical protein
MTKVLEASMTIYFYAEFGFYLGFVQIMAKLSHCDLGIKRLSQLYVINRQEA